MKYYRKEDGSLLRVSAILDFPEITVEEYEAEMQRVSTSIKANAEHAYWATIPYDEAVNARIREKYTESQEFAILRQRDEKPEEYAEYYAYCEDCKTFVKEKKGL